MSFTVFINSTLAVKSKRPRAHPSIISADGCGMCGGARPSIGRVSNQLGQPTKKQASSTFSSPVSRNLSSCRRLRNWRASERGTAAVAAAAATSSIKSHSGCCSQTTPYARGVTSRAIVLCTPAAPGVVHGYDVTPPEVHTTGLNERSQGRDGESAEPASVTSLAIFNSLRLNCFFLQRFTGNSDNARECVQKSI